MPDLAKARKGELYLVRRRGSEYIHTSACRHATSGGMRWIWADENPTVDWKLTAPWLKPCRRCNPPSPFRPENPDADPR